MHRYALKHRSSYFDISNEKCNENILMTQINNKNGNTRVRHICQNSNNLSIGNYLTIIGALNVY